METGKFNVSKIVKEGGKRLKSRLALALAGVLSASAVVPTVVSFLPETVLLLLNQLRRGKNLKPL